MATTLDTINKILHIYYARYLTSTTNDRTNIRDLVSKDSRKFDGSVLRMGLVDGFPASGGALGPGATIPDSEESSVDVTNVYLSYHYFPIEIDWDVEEHSSGPHAWIRASALEIERVRKWSLLHFERQMASDGSGIIAGEPNPAATNLLPLVNVTALNPLTFTIDKLYGIRFQKKQRIEIWDPGGTTLNPVTMVLRAGPDAGGTHYTIANIQHSGNTTTVTTEETVTAGANEPGNNQATYYDIVAQAGAIKQDYYSGTDNASNEEAGLSLICGASNWPMRPTSKSGFTPTASTFQDVSSASAQWAGAEVDAGGNKILGPGIFEDVNLELGLTGSHSIDEIGMILTNPFQVAKFRRTLYPMELFTKSDDSPHSFPSGAKSSMKEQKTYLTWGGIPIIPSRFIKPDEALLPNLEYIKVYENTPYKFAAADGSMWQRNPNGRASYRAVAYKYEAIGCISRNCHAKVKNLDVTRV